MAKTAGRTVVWEPVKITHRTSIGAGPNYDDSTYTSLSDYAVKLAADKEGLTITGNFVPVTPE